MQCGRSVMSLSGYLTFSWLSVSKCDINIRFLCLYKCKLWLFALSYVKLFCHIWPSTKCWKGHINLPKSMSNLAEDWYKCYQIYFKGRVLSRAIKPVASMWGQWTDPTKYIVPAVSRRGPLCLCPSTLQWYIVWNVTQKRKRGKRRGRTTKHCIQCCSWWPNQGSTLPGCCGWN